MKERFSKNIVPEMLRLTLPVLILAAGVLSCWFMYAIRLQPLHRPLEAIQPPIVEAVAMTPKTDGFEIVVSGEVVPFREIGIAAEVNGRIVTDHARAGYFVRKGELLVEIDTTNYEIETRRHKEELNQAGIRIRENGVATTNTETLIEWTQKNLALQIKEEKRLGVLVQSQTVSVSEYDSVQRGVIAARMELTRLENELKLLRQKKFDLESSHEQSKIQLTRSEEDLRRCRIEAPCDGVIVRDFTEAGNYVTAGQSLLVFEDVTKIEVKCHLQAKELYWLWMHQGGRETQGDPQQTCYEIPETDAIVSWSIEGRTWHWHGKLARYDGYGVNAATRTAAVCIEIPDPRNAFVSDANHEILPPALTRGIFVTASIHVDPGIPLWQIPSAGLRSGNKIYATDNKRLEIHDVQLVRRNKDFAIIRLPSDDLSSFHCVTSVLAHPQHGMSIRVAPGKENDTTSLASRTTGGQR